jgi:hypothetical protein
MILHLVGGEVINQMGILHILPMVAVKSVSQRENLPGDKHDLIICRSTG